MNVLGLSLSDEDVERVAARVFEKLVPLFSGPKHPEWADKTCNPYGSARAFLDAARRKEFPTFRRKRLVTAKWKDVAAAIERVPAASGRRSRTAHVTEPVIDVDTVFPPQKARARRGQSHG